MVDEPEYASLREALQQSGIPDGNHATVIGIVESIGIRTFSARKDGHIRAIRRGDGTDLEIAFGWTDGFDSEAEAQGAAPHLRPRADTTVKNRWHVVHPDNHVRTGEQRLPDRPAAEKCPHCFTEKASNGSCLCD
jgi:hypothetical protein